MGKVIYLGTTDKCSACKCQKYILKDVVAEADYSNIELVISDYTDLPDWIKKTVRLTDFPITILTKDKVIKSCFIGTMPKKRFKEYMKDINY